MRGDIPQAAFRLLTDERLIVRTHIGDYYERNQGGERFCGRAARPVAVRGTEYPSINAAIAALHTSHKHLMKMIRMGTAEYIEPA